jgi:hypothetical protein
MRSLVRVFPVPAERRLQHEDLTMKPLRTLLVACALVACNAAMARLAPNDDPPAFAAHGSTRVAGYPEPEGHTQAQVAAYPEPEGHTQAQVAAYPEPEGHSQPTA